MDTLKKLVIIIFLFVFDQYFGPLLLPRKTTKNSQTSESGEKNQKIQKSSLGRCQEPLSWLLLSEKAFEKIKLKRRKPSEGELIATNVYRAMFKNSSEKKLPKLQMIMMKSFEKEKSIFQKNARNQFLGQELNFLGLVKWPKTTL